MNLKFHYTLGLLNKKSFLTAVFSVVVLMHLVGQREVQYVPYIIYGQDYPYQFSRIEFTGQTEVLSLTPRGLRPVYTSEVLNVSKAAALELTMGHLLEANTKSGLHLEVPYLYLYKQEKLGDSYCNLKMQVDFYQDGKRIFHRSIEDKCTSPDHEDLHTALIGQGVESALVDFRKYEESKAIPAADRPSNGLFRDLFDFQCMLADTLYVPKIRRRKENGVILIERPENDHEIKMLDSSWGFLIDDTAYYQTSSRKGVQMVPKEQIQPEIINELLVSHVIDDYYLLYYGSSFSQILDLEGIAIKKTLDDYTYAQIPYTFDSLNYRYTSMLDNRIHPALEQVFLYHSGFSKEDSLYISCGKEKWRLERNQYVLIDRYAGKGMDSIKICGTDDCLTMHRKGLQKNADYYLIKSKKGMISSQRSSISDIGRFHPKEGILIH